MMLCCFVVGMGVCESQEMILSAKNLEELDKYERMIRVSEHWWLSTRDYHMLW